MPRIHNWEEWDDVEVKSQNKKEQNEKPNQNKKQPNNRNNT
jgi:hypothetical protein